MLAGLAALLPAWAAKIVAEIATRFLKEFLARKDLKDSVRKGIALKSAANAKEALEFLREGGDSTVEVEPDAPSV